MCTNKVDFSPLVSFAQINLFYNYRGIRIDQSYTVNNGGVVIVVVGPLQHRHPLYPKVTCDRLVAFYYYYFFFRSSFH